MTTIVACDNNRSVGLYLMKRMPSSLDTFLYEEKETIDIVVSENSIERRNLMLDWSKHWFTIDVNNASRLYQMG